MAGLPVASLSRQRWRPVRLRHARAYAGFALIGNTFCLGVGSADPWSVPRTPDPEVTA